VVQGAGYLALFIYHEMSEVHAPTRNSRDIRSRTRGVIALI